MIKTALYMRYSSTAQRSESIDGQRRICRQYAEAHDLAIVAEYIDEAQTGTNDKRPAFQKMVRESATGKWQALLVYSVDRFARNQYDSAIYERKLELNGIRIHYATQDFGDKPESIILYSVMKGYAEYYSKNLAIQVKRGLTENALKALCNTGAPLGYTANSKHEYTIDPVTAPYVRFIFEQYAEGGTISEIARKLNAMGARTKEGKLFSRGSFNALLKNELYIGTYHYDTIRIENAVPALISRELFEAVQTRRSQNRSTPARNKAADEFILTGKLFCGVCGAPMIGDSGKSHTGKIYTYYTCANRKRPPQNRPRCTKKAEVKSVLESAIIKFLYEALDDTLINQIADAVTALIAEQSAQASRIPFLQSQLASVKSKINGIITAIEDGLYTPAMKDRMHALQQEATALETQIAQEEQPRPAFNRDQILYFLYSLKTGSTASPDFQRRLIDALLNTATILGNAEDKKIALVLNLSANATREIRGSDLQNEIHQYFQYPNRIHLLNDTTAVIVRQYAV